MLLLKSFWKAFGWSALLPQERSDASDKAAGSPAKKMPTQSSSSTMHAVADVQSLYALAGVSIGKTSSSSRTANATASSVDGILISSEEDKEDSTVKLPTMDQPAGKAWFDAKRGCMVRGIPGEAGAVEEAAMSPGDSGFLVATFPGESGFETEIPNSLISLAKGSPSASKAKGKAKAKAKGKAVAKGKAKSHPKGKAKAKPKGKAKANAVAACDELGFLCDTWLIQSSCSCKHCADRASLCDRCNGSTDELVVSCAG